MRFIPHILVFDFDSDQLASLPFIVSALKTDKVMQNAGEEKKESLPNSLC